MPEDITIPISVDASLKEVAQNGDIDAFYRLIREDPDLLERIDKIAFIQTPLHQAAAAGQTRFASEIMWLKPSFARKLNPDGFSPIHLALQKGHTQMVLRFVEVDADLIRVKGREGLTPLHYVTQTGNCDLLENFLFLCPKSFEDLTIRKESALHIAVKNDMFEALDLFLHWLPKIIIEGRLELEKSVNWKDDEGNTVLHIAASKNSRRVIKSLLNIYVLDVNAKNLEGWIALDILNHQRQPDNGELKQMLLRAKAIRASRLPSVTTGFTQILKLRISHWDYHALTIICGWINISNDNRNALLVVAGLIATATYQAGLSPPGGVCQIDCQQPSNSSTHTAPSPYVGKTVLSQFDFSVFAYFNDLAFYFSTVIISVLLPLSSRSLSVVLLLLLCVLLICHMWSMYLVSGSTYVFGRGPSGAEIVRTFTLLFCALALLLNWIMIMRVQRLLLRPRTGWTRKREMQ